MDPVVIWAATFFGGMLAALFGWAEANEPFNWKKFIRSVGIALASSIALSVTYNYNEPINIIDILAAIGVGLGADVLVDRGVGTVKTLLKK